MLSPAVLQATGSIPAVQPGISSGRGGSGSRSKSSSPQLLLQTHSSMRQREREQQEQSARWYAVDVSGMEEWMHDTDGDRGVGVRGGGVAGGGECGSASPGGVVGARSSTQVDALDRIAVVGGAPSNTDVRGTLENGRMEEWMHDIEGDGLASENEQGSSSQQQGQRGIAGVSEASPNSTLALDVRGGGTTGAVTPRSNTMAAAMHSIAGVLVTPSSTSREDTGRGIAGAMVTHSNPLAGDAVLWYEYC